MSAFLAPLLPSFRQTHSFTASPVWELQVGWMFHESHPQPFRCSELLWSLAGPRNLFIFCFHFAPNVPTNLVSQISWFQSPLCGFAAEPTYSSEPADLPPAPPFPCPILQNPFQVLGSRQGPHVSPGSWEGGCVLSLCIPDSSQSLVI